MQIHFLLWGWVLALGSFGPAYADDSKSKPQYEFGCATSFYDRVYNRHVRNSPILRCCEPGITPDGVSYGGDWCDLKKNHLVHEKERSCRFYPEKKRGPRPYGVRWKCQPHPKDCENCAPGESGGQPGGGIGSEAGGSTGGGTAGAGATGSTGSPSVGGAQSNAEAAAKLAKEKEERKRQEEERKRQEEQRKRQNTGGGTNAGKSAPSIVKLPISSGEYDQERMDDVITHPTHNHYLTYTKMDSDHLDSVIETIGIHKNKIESGNKQIIYQMGLETEKMKLKEFAAALSDPSNPTRQRIERLAKTIASIDSDKMQFILRPFSEMNAGGVHWDFGHGNSAQDYANAWKALRKIFRDAGAKNAAFAFAPVAGRGTTSHLATTERALKLIPAGDIDAFGVNTYARPTDRTRGDGRSGTSSRPYDSFKKLSEPWLKMLARTPHASVQKIAPEFGCSNQGTDANRAKWFSEAYDYMAEQGFVSSTLFRASSTEWGIEEGSKTDQTVRTSTGQFMSQPLSQ